MKHALPGIALFVFLGCSETSEIPTVELGGPSGARLMNGQGRGPYETYDNAYSQLHRQHYNVLRNLESRNPSAYAAKAAVDSILQSLETMRSLVGPADRPRFDPYLARYRGWSADLGSNRWGGSFKQDVERSEYELKSKFSPENVEIVADASAAQPAPAPAPRPAAAANPTASVPDDKAVTPERTSPPPVPAPAPAVAPVPAPPAGAPNAASARLFYKAWDRSHDDLLAAYKAKKDCRAAYEDVIGALRQLHANTAAEKRSKLQIYLDYYAGIHEKTKGFTALPEGEKIAEKDIVDELDVAARVIRKEFNPDK